MGRVIFMGFVMFLIVVEIVILSPASLEESGGLVQVEQGSLVVDGGGGGWLATGIPRGRVPEYSVDQFHYMSTQNGVKQWKLLASKAHFYHGEKIVHALEVKAWLYDPGGKTTVIEGREAKYFMDKRDLEVFGVVQTEFPDGFKTKSEYMRYLPEERRMDVPLAFDVEGAGKGEGEKGQDIFFQSKGLDYRMASGEVLLPKEVHFTMVNPSERTEIDSDYCWIFRSKQLAEFRMEVSRPLDKRFVEIRQPRFHVRSRRVDLQYGDFSKLLQYLVATEDVLIQEKNEGKKDKKEESEVDESPASLRYGTGGRADFDTKRDVIVLTEFPQVYQDKDTVTGEVIILHRDSDLVEVEHSNAFSEGQ